MFDIIQFR